MLSSILSLSAQRTLNANSSKTVKATDLKFDVQNYYFVEIHLAEI